MPDFIPTTSSKTQRGLTENTSILQEGYVLLR